MKTLKIALKAILISASLWGLSPAVSAQVTSRTTKTGKAAQIQRWLEQKQFTFVPSYMNPMRGTSSVWQLTSEYSLKVSGDTVQCYLPYFGRAYSAPLGPDDAGIKFNSTDADYSVVQTKKDRWEVTIKPHGTQNVASLLLRVFDNGSASLYVTSNTKDPISFEGSLAGTDSRRAQSTDSRK